VGFIYWLTGNSIIVVRLLKCVLSSITVLLIYRISKRNFDDQTARVAAIICALWPNFWYYCAVHLKETEMVFLGVLFVEQADQMLRSRQFTAWKIVPILLIAAAIFTVRTPLGLVAILSLVFSVVMSSQRVVSWGKRIIVGFLAILLVVVVAGNVIQEKSEELFKQAQGDQQQRNMEWRGERENGNAFARYAGKSVFAPLIFTIPFPSMTRPYEGQDVQQLLNGGNFVKNILSGFTIFAMVMLLISGKWREHLLPLSFLLGYLVVLTMSTFAQSERFHQPVMPFELMFAAYGLSVAVTKKKYKRWFMYWCALMFLACIAWNWFKLAGRGLA
jgi:4-amino-4-deoxy-L-arabinose transferase-like glycosyltransferase